MKKILSLLVCMFMVIGMLPAFTVSAADAPEWVAGIGTLETPGTLISEYSFANTDIPGQAIPNNFPTDATVASNEYAAEYTSEGFKITRLQDGTTSNNGTVSSYTGRINFVDVTDEAAKSYETGFRGTYVVDLTINADMKKPTANTNKNAPRFDMWMGYNEDITSNSNANKDLWNGLRFTSSHTYTLYDNKLSNSSAYTDGGGSTATTAARGVDETYRFVFDTVNGQIAHYKLTDGAYAYIGSGEYFGDSLQGMTINPRLGFAKDSYFTFKNIKIYEVTRAEEPLIKVVNESTTPDPEPEPEPTPDPEPDPEPEPDQGDDTIVADPTNNIPDWAEVIGLTAEPGTKVGDYKFTGSDIPGENIPNTFNNSSDFKSEYTEDGFTWTKTTEPEAADRATQSGFGGVLHIVANLENDDTNGTSTYQHGLVGKYVVDLYVNSNLSMNLSGNAARFDWDIGYQSNLTNASKVEKTFNTVRCLSGGGTNSFTFYGSSAYGQGDRNLPKGQDAIVRFVIDTKEKQMAYFIYKNNEFVFSGNGAYDGDIIQSMYFTPRLGFAKGSTFTFKGVKIYEIEKYINPDLGIADRNQAITDTMADETAMPKKLVDDASAVVENITLPSGNWTTSNDDVITTTGIVKQGYDDEKVILTNKFVTPSTPSLQLFKFYELNVSKMADITNETILDEAVNETVESYEKVVNRVIASDTYSKTYVNNHKGVYDFEFKVKPTVTNGAEPLAIQVGYKTGDEFTNYASANIYSDVVKYSSNLASQKSASLVNGESNTIIFRVDTVNKKVWVYINGVRSSVMVYTGNDYVNSFKLLGNGVDSLVLENVKVVSLFDFDNESFVDTNMNDCFGNSSAITISDVTSNPSDAYGAMGSMPETLNGYEVKWSADSDYVDVAGKYAYRSSEDQDVTVTAEIYDSANSDICVMKDFNIKIAKTTDPKLLLEGSTSKLAPKFITNQPADGLITDIVLPESIMGNTVAWTSSNPDVLSANGVINKNKDISVPTKVTLTATVTGSGTSVTKDIEFTVAKRGGDVTLYTNGANIETAITGVVTYEADLNGVAVLADSNGKKIIELDETGKVKVVMDFNNSKVTLFKDGVLVKDYVDFAEAAENFAGVNSSSVSNEKIVLDEYALYNYNIEKFGYFDVLGKGYVTEDVDMNTETVGGAVVKWNSENTALLANDGTYNALLNVSFINVELSITLPGGTGAKYSETLNVVAIPEDNIFFGSNVTNQGVAVPAGEYQTAMMFDGNYSDTMFRGAFSEETDSIIVDMKNTQDINTVFVANNGLESADIYVSTDKNQWTLVAQPEFDGSSNKNLVTFEKENARYVKICNISYEGEYVDIYEIAGFVVYDASDRSYMDILEIDMPEEYVLTTTSLVLPETGILYGSEFAWKSSNPDVISANGTVTKPVNNTEVLLTVTSKNGDATSTKTYRYLVKGTSGAQGGTPSGGSGGGGGGNLYIGDTSSSAFPETNTTVQTPIASSDKLFEDVETTDWFYAYVLDLKNENIVNGDNYNRFNPNNYVTREEFVKMIVSAAGIKLVENGTGFVDVNSSAWYAPYVYAAKANSIVNGISETEFGVSAPISRQDMSVIINNIIDVDADISTNRDIFTDDANISSYAYEAVYTMKSLGILNGYESGEFNPKGQLTRAEAAKVISMVTDIIK